MIATAAALIRRHFLLLAALSLLAGSLGRFFYLFGFGETFVTRWLLRQYYVNFVDFGFTKRGVIGTLFHPYLAGPGNNELGGQILVILFEVVVLAGLALFLRRLAGGKDGGGMGQVPTLVLAAFVLSPVGFMQFGNDVGRYDHINILIVGSAALLALRGRHPIAGALFALAVLIHEAAFFYGAGPLLAVLLAGRARLRDIAICLAPAAAALAVVGLWGNLTPAELALLATRPGADTSVWARGVIETPLGLKAHEVAALAFYLVVPFYVMFTIVRHNGGSIARMFAPQLITLCLFPLGFDYFRWAGLCFVSIAITMLLLADREGWTLPRYPRAVAWLMLVYLLPLGPLGTAHPLPFIELPIVYRDQLFG